MLDILNKRTNVPGSMQRLTVLTINARRKSFKKDTTNRVDMEQNADSKAGIHVNLSMKLNHIKKKCIVAMKLKSNL